jgi:hypothetical protein
MLYILKKTDTWHGNPVFIGVFNNRSLIRDNLRYLLKDELGDDIEEQIKFFEEEDQTQGLETNYFVEEVEINTLYYD